MSRQSTIPATDEIWVMIKETQKSLKEFQKKREADHKKFQAAQREFQVAQKELQIAQKEFQVAQKETGQQIKELRASQKETGQQMRETDKTIKAVVGDFGNRWGKLAENLVKGGLAQRLKEREIEVERVITNAKNDSSEFDIIAINGKEVVVVEVKATLDPSDVNEFTEDIQRFTMWWPEFKDKTIYGAMAFLIKANRQSGHLAQKRGFFVIEAVGDVIIQNKKGFKPRVFS